MHIVAFTLETNVIDAILRQLQAPGARWPPS